MQSAMCESVKKDPIQFWNTIRDFTDAGGAKRLGHISCGLRLRQEKCYNFTVTDLMKQKFVASVVYEISKQDDILNDLAEASPIEN